MTPTIERLYAPANTDFDPFETRRSAIEWLCLLREEALKLDVAAMSPERRRQHDEILEESERVIAYLLARP